MKNDDDVTYSEWLSPFPEWSYIDATGYVMVDDEDQEEYSNKPSKKIKEFLSELTLDELDKLGFYAIEEIQTRPHYNITKGQSITIEVEVLETRNSSRFFSKNTDYLIKVGSEKVEISYDELVEISTKLGKLL